MACDGIDVTVDGIDATVTTIDAMVDGSDATVDDIDISARRAIRGIYDGVYVRRSMGLEYILLVR